MFDVIIIGGGIGGMHASYLLSKKLKNVLLLDERNYLGGRVKTHYRPQFEIGAGRFNSNHKIFMTLVKRFNISIFKLSEARNYLSKKGLFLEKSNEFFKKSIMFLINKSKQHSKKNLKTVTFREFCLYYISKKELQFIIDIFGYTSEFNVMNAYNAINSFKQDFISSKFYIAAEGLRTMITHLENASKNNGASFKKNEKVVDVYLENNNYCVLSNERKYLCERVIFATKAYDLLKFNLLKSVFPNVRSVQSQPLLRIYMKYPVRIDGVWFNKMDTTTTNGILRQIIPINYETGLIMISYTDGSDVKSFLTQEGELKSEPQIKKIIATELKSLFPSKNIPEPIYYYAYLWKQGCHYWKKNKDSEKISPQMLNPLENIYICGESFSQQQAWMEGALQTSTQVVELINKKN